MNAKKATMNVCCFKTFGMIVGWAGMLVSAQAYALSLGGFQVESALDEPLRAEIRLDSVDAKTLESLEVTLGSQEDFQRADVPRSEFLNQLQFSVSSESGTPVVRVTTEQAIREPFLHFLVAAEWSGGKLVREYTGLLDPPLYAGQPPSTIESATVESTTRETASSTAPAAMVSEEATSSAPSMKTTVTGRSAEYGPTQKGDTLWGIASKLDTGALQVNVFQVMVALLRENPDAFIDNNINLLKTGQILQLKDVAAIAAVPSREATSVYTAQLEDWESYKSRVAVAGDEVQVAGSDTSAGSGETMTASSDQAGAEDTQKGVADQASAAQGGQEEDVLRIVQATLDTTGESETASAGSDQSGEIAELRGQIATLEESIESRNLENQELQERVRLLESQLENAQRLVEIESQELAAAQQQAAELAAAQQSAEEEAQASTQQMTAQPATKVKVEEQASQQATPVQKSSEEAKSGETMVASVENKSESGQQASAVTPAAKPEDNAQKVRKVANRPPQSSWWANVPDLLFSSWMWMVGAGVGVLVLLLGLLMFLRRRQSIAEFEESILSGSALDSYSETTDTAGTSASDTSFLSDFGTAGMGTMQADEVDPLAEAEVYLAYGRDEQAEEVLKEAARRDPDRSEVKLKLLEIYKQRKDVKSFETIAEELYPAGDQGDHETWNQVSRMGREVSPDNPLFQDAGGGDINTINTINTVTSETNPSLRTHDTGNETDFSLDKSLESETGQSSVTTQPRQAANVEDLDLDFDVGRDTASATQDGTLDLGDDLLKTASGNVDPSTQPFPTPDQQTDLDRELERLASERETGMPGAGKGDKSAAQSPRGASAAEDEPEEELSWDKADSKTETLDFPSSDNSEIEFDLNLDDSSIQQLAESDAEGLESSRDTSDTDRDDGEGLMEFESENIPPEETWAVPSTDAAPGSSEEHGDVRSSGVPEYNEAETKLDLARAYLDMGDKVGARSIIDEVMREGDPAQRDQAAELASQL